ncbi:bacterial alpha-L-rhamnosidase-domain-containing protein [Mycena vulgaris]|nr:bacterial alpha-L-rhamnosidase-domain-containing protein [Mycena vulgaris]
MGIGLLSKEIFRRSLGNQRLHCRPSSWPPILVDLNLPAESAQRSAWRRRVPQNHRNACRQKATSGIMVTTADDHFTLYLNSAAVGSAPNGTDAWQFGQAYRVQLNPSVNVVTLRGFAIRVLYDDGTLDVIRSDATWKARKISRTDSTCLPQMIPLGPARLLLGFYGVSPWNGDVSIADSLGEHPAPLLRKSFTLNKQIIHARLYYSADGYASISLNGVLVSDHVLSPGFTKYDTRIQYTGLDVASLLVDGENDITAELGGSHYSPLILSSASDIIPGYDRQGFNDSAWQAPGIMAVPSGALVNARQPPTRNVGSLTPLFITEPVPGLYVAAFERVVAGWARITVTGYQDVQLEGWPTTHPPTPEDVIGQIVHDDLGSRGGFQSSNGLLNALHQAVVYTMLNNIHSLPTDCPVFEKNGWTGDAMLGTEMFLSNFGSSEFLGKYIGDVDDPRSQGLPDVIGQDAGFGSSGQAPTWQSIYAYRGDKRILMDHYDSMKAYVDLELARSPGNIASTRLGDWVTPETSPTGGNPPEDSRVPATAFLHEYHMFDAVSEVASIIGEEADSATFAAQATDIKHPFNAEFIDATTGHYVGVGDSGYRQSNNIFTLAFGLTPNTMMAQAVADSDITSRNIDLKTGALSMKHLLQALTAHGYGDIASRRTDDVPQLGILDREWCHYDGNQFFPLDWEHWPAAAVLMTSTSPAFQTVDIQPSITGHLASTSGRMLTPFGNLPVSWRNIAGLLTIEMVVPVGINATIMFPGGINAIVAGGDDISTIPGVIISNASRREVPMPRVTVGSSRYSFSDGS